MISQTQTSTTTDDVFIAVEMYPRTDMQKLYGNIVYPIEARRAGLEGSVVVKVLVGSDSTIKKVEIESSTNRIFEETAIKAAKSAVFTPAKKMANP